ncbi:MAG: hypothetical protein WEA04_02475 [Candidatus Andersenbacteria bacterium]
MLKVLVLLILMVAGLATWFWVDQKSFQDIPETPIVSIRDQTNQATLTMTLIHQGGEGRQVLVCEQKSCDIKAAPPTLTGEAVFDGTSWFYYHEYEDEQLRRQRTILQKVEPTTNHTVPIIEDTPLTTPRGLHISPNGQHLAFFLDNIDQPKVNLTELWFYDAAKDGIRLLAEKLYRPDILTPVRWNRSSSLLWFLADNGPQDKPGEMIELIIARLQPTSVKVEFKHLPWEKLRDVAATGVMDITASGDMLAYAHENLFTGGQLVVAAATGDIQQLSVRGRIPYVQWLEDGSLLYAVQDTHGFTLWRLQNAVHRHVARQNGTLHSAQSNVQGEYIAFIAATVAKQPQLYSLHLPSGQLTHEGALRVAQGDLKIIHLQAVETVKESLVAGSMSEFDDAELVAFIDQQLGRIVGNNEVQPKRLIMTEQVNTVYVDYVTQNEDERRILIAVRDIIHAEWSIKARYQAVQAEWKKVQGGGLQDPAPLRFYEWEESLQQWILKSARP